MASHTATQDSLVGQTLGHYRIVEKIGAGGMGEVYRAHDEHLDRDAAIKVLPPQTFSDESARKHFRKEALALSKLNHPNIATIHDFDTQQGVDFLVMEYIPGITLSEKLSAGPLPAKEVLRLGVQLAEGLVAAHERGIVHRDLKPGNLRLTDDGRLKSLDFGLAKLRLPVTASAATESLSESRAIAGTLPYMAPEQLLGGEIDARTDIHAAGLVLYEMVTGRYPFAEVEPSQLIGAILHRPPRTPAALNPHVSPELERIIGKCLEKEPESRYQSAKELTIDLRRLQAGVLSATPLAVERAKRSYGKWAGLGLAILVAAILLLIAFNVGGWRQRLPGRTYAPRVESLAVLPLANLSGDPQQDYFADGMTEALIAELGQIGSLRVISRTSIMQYKETKKPLPQIARELNVDAVIEGSVLRAGDRIRITVQLIGAFPERHLWARNYERDLRDVLSVQGEIAQTIAAEVRANVSPAVQSRLAGARQVNPQAHDAYLQALSGKDCIGYAQQAVHIDPNYAQAYGLLASCYWYGSHNAGGHLTDTEAADKAQEAAMKALEIDDTLAEPHIALGQVLFWHYWDWAGSERHFKRAIELNPNLGEAHGAYAWYLAFMGRRDESIREAERALELDPFSPGSIPTVAAIYFLARQYDQALVHARKCIEMPPDNAACYSWLTWILQVKGLYDQEVLIWQKAMTLDGGKPEDVAALGQAYKAGGIKDVWRWKIESVKAGAAQDEFAASKLAAYYALLGEKEEALGWLEKAYAEHDDRMYSIKVDQGFDSLRSDPRFQDLLHRMNFPQ